MKIFSRIITHFLKTLILLFLLLILIYLVLSVLLSNSLISTDSFQLFIIISSILILLFFSFWYGWYLCKPLFKITTIIEELGQNKTLNSQINPSVQFSTHVKIYEELFLNIDKLSQRLNENKKKQEQLDKAKSEWISGVSHDLKTPLSYIKAYSKLLNSPQYNWEEEEKEKYLNIIEEKSMYLEELIKDLNLQFSINNGDIMVQKSTVDIVYLTENLVIDAANNPNSAEQLLSFKTSIPSCYIDIDEKITIRSINNFLINSIKHNPAKTHIDVSIQLSQSSLIVEIKDNGKGIDDRILKDLEQNKRNYNGHGMVIGKKLIELQDGKILIQSEIEKGTSIQIIFKGVKS